MIATAGANAEAEGAYAEAFGIVAAKERHVVQSSSWNEVLKKCQTIESSFKKAI